MLIFWVPTSNYMLSFAFKLTKKGKYKCFLSSIWMHFDTSKKIGLLSMLNLPIVMSNFPKILNNSTKKMTNSY